MPGPWQALHTGEQHQLRRIRLLVVGGIARSEPQGHAPWASVGIPQGQWLAWRKVLLGLPLDREDSVWISRSVGSVQDLLRLVA